MDRNTVIGFVLLGALFIGFFWFQSQSAHKLEAEQAKQAHTEDSIRQVHRADSIAQATQLEQKKKEQALLQEKDTTGMTPAQVVKVEDSVSRVQKSKLFGPFLSASGGNESIDSIENEQLKIYFTNKGGRILRAELKEYKDYKGNPLLLIDGKENHFGYSFFYDNDKSINTDSLYFTPLRSADGKSITYRLNAGNGKSLDQVYAFNDTAYLVNYNLKFTGFDSIIPGTIPTVVLDWQQDMNQQEKNMDYERRYSSLYFSYNNGDIDYKSANGEIKFNSKVKWVSCQQQFFNATLIARNGFENSGKIAIYSTDSSRFVKRCNTELDLTFNNKSSFDFPMQFYLAPNNYSELKKLDVGLQEIVPTGSGILRWINRGAIIPLFHWLGSFINNYGLIILLLTLIIKLVLSPLTYRSFLSMAKMRVIQPEIGELREKYKDDQARFGQEQLKLFRRAGVSPLGGCLPTLLSMPILLAMFRLFPGSIELRQQSFLWAKDLSSYDDLIHWNFNIPFLGEHLSIFCLLMTASSLMYVRMNMQNSTSQLPGGMKTMQYIFPFFLFFFLNSSPAGLTYYYFVSNMTTFGMQWGIRRFLINEQDIHKKIQENKAKPVKKSRFQQRLEDAMKQQQKLKEAKSRQKK